MLTYKKYGYEYISSVAYTIELTNSNNFKHKFGGSSWKILDRNMLADGPVLLFSLDLKDPKLRDLEI